MPDLTNPQKVENTGDLKPNLEELGPFGCNYAGRVLVDGKVPSVQVSMNITSYRMGEKPSVREIILPQNGTFSFYVPKGAGSYLLEPSFPPGVNYRETFRNGSLSGIAEYMCREEEPEDEKNIVLRWSSSHSNSVPQDPSHRFNRAPNSSL